MKVSAKLIHSTQKVRGLVYNVSRFVAGFPLRDLNKEFTSEESENILNSILFLYLNHLFPVAFGYFLKPNSQACIQDFS